MIKRHLCVALVCNRAYLHKALRTIWQLRTFGRFGGDVVLVVGDDLRPALTSLASSFLRIIPIYFPDIDQDFKNELIRRAPSASDLQKQKTFQLHKFYCFSTFFTQWHRVLYLDSGMRIYAPLRPLLEMDVSGALMAHSDAFPTFEWNLSDQFNFKDFPDLEQRQSEIVDFGADYFQTTMMFYDSAIIEEKSVQELIQLTQEFPNCRTNDQGVINIWAQKKGIWSKLPTRKYGKRFLYDFHERQAYGAEDYLMLKYPSRPRKDYIWTLSHVVFGILMRIKGGRLLQLTSKSE